MGTDIHMHVEVKLLGDWHHYNHPEGTREYALFSKMAGVRLWEEHPPIVLPKGMPEDATFSTRFDYERSEGNAHTPSWLNRTELWEICEWYDEQEQKHHRGSIEDHNKYFGYLYGNTFNPQWSESDPPGLEDVRLVFWFDN